MFVFVSRRVRKIGKRATTIFVMSVCPSACNNSAPTGRIFMKFDIRFFLICHRKCKHILNPGKIYVFLYAFFWVIPLHLNFICQWRFGTLFHLHRPIRIWRWNRQSAPKRHWRTKFRRRGNYPEESMQHSEGLWYFT